ncbi:MFS transporter [Roseateles chitinivorans]|uniref:MFS transporter n=1 Tax=Roseateles chitinivorans TaxID=2917965 RepID=UPI003D6799FE
MISKRGPASNRDRSIPKEEPGRGFHARVVAAAALGLVGGFAALHFSTLAIFLKPIAADFGWGRAITSLATVLSMLGMAVGAALVGPLIDRVGTARVIGTSIIGMSVLTCALSWVPNSPVALAALMFCIGMAGVATTPLGYLTEVSRWFGGRLGFALGVAMQGLGLGAIIFPVVTQSLIAKSGWRDAYIVLGLTGLLIGALAWALLFSGAGRRAAQHRESVGEPEQLRSSSLSDALRQRRYWVLLVVLLSVSSAGLGTAVHGVALLTDRGISPGDAAFIASLSGAGVMLGRLVAGALLDRLSISLVCGTSFLLGAVGMTLTALTQGPAVPPLVVGAFLAGLTLGVEGDLIPFAVRRYFGSRSFGGIYGTLFAVYILGGVAGPVIFGWSFDQTGTYRQALLGGAGLCTLSAALCLCLDRPFRLA